LVHTQQNIVIDKCNCATGLKNGVIIFRKALSGTVRQNRSGRAGLLSNLTQ
jgi:hypothetical protein